MPHFRRRAVAATATVALLATAGVACGSDTGSGGRPDRSEEDSSSGSQVRDPRKGTPSEGPDESRPDDAGGSETKGGDLALPTGDDIDIAGFATVVRAAMNSVTTARITLRADAGAEGEGGGGAGVLDVASDRDALQLELTDDQSGDRSVFLMIDGAVYLKEDADSSDKFMKMGREHASMGFYVLFHPHQLTESFLDAADAVEHVGPDRAGGLHTEHYRLSADAADLGDVFAGVAPAGGDSSTFEQEIWLASDGRLVRSRITVSNGSDDFTLDSTLTDFGGPPSVEEPPASQVEDVEQYGAE